MSTYGRFWVSPEVAILAVLAFHIQLFQITSGPVVWERVYSYAAGVGWAGVDLFFVLSGFLITGILIQSKEHADYYRIFYARRTLRIFPLYYFSLALFFFVGPFVLKLMHHADAIRPLIHPSSQIFAWTYILNWRIGFASFSVVPLFLQHFWSLSIEEQFYLAWPFVVRTLARQSLARTCAVLIAASLACRVLFQLLHMPTAAYVLTFCRLDALAIGAFVALAILDRRLWKNVAQVAPLLTAGALGGLITLVAVTKRISFIGPWMGTVGISLWGLFFGGCLVMALSAQEESLLHRIASWRVFQFFGKYSYGLYVYHVPLTIILSWEGINSQELDGVLHSRILAVVVANGVALLLSIVTALASWHLFEKHFLKLKELVRGAPSASVQVANRSV